MKYFLHITILSIISVNACNQNIDRKISSSAISDSIVSKNDITTDISAAQGNSNNVSDKPVITSSKKNSAQIENKKDFFILLNASSEDWTAGIPNGGRGTEYYFKIKVNTQGKMLFDTAWINNKTFGIYISKGKGLISNTPTKYSYEDTIILRVSDIHSKPIANKNTENNNLPIKYDGAALISYTVNGKKEYYTIKEIKKQPTINRP